MSFLKSLWARTRASFSGNRTKRLDDELELHTELLASEYIRQGMHKGDAWAAARRELGNHTSVREAYYDESGFPLLEAIGKEVKYAIRTLWRNQAFTGASLLTLAVGLSGVVTMLAVISALFWTPLPYPDPQRLVALHELDPQKGQWTFSEPDLIDLQQRCRSLDAVAGFRRGTAALAGTQTPEQVQIAAVTPSMFAMTGVGTLAGRMFHAGMHEAIISRALWNRRWAGKRSAIGQAIKLDGETYQIAGVNRGMPDLLPGVDVFVPLQPNAADSRSAHDIEAFGRLARGATIDQLQAELNTIAQSISRENSRTNTNWSLTASPLRDYLLPPGTTRIVWMISGGVGLVWLLACTNVAGLQLARRIAQRKEFETRLALGAGRSRLLGQALTESLVLTCAGALLGLFAAAFVIDSLRRAATEFLPRLAGLHMDFRTVGATVACMLASTLLFGFVPHGRSLRLGQRGGTTRSDGRDSLMIAEVALGSVLMLAAALLLQNFLRLQAVDPGFNPDRLSTVRLDFSNQRQEDWKRIAFLRQLMDRVRELPGVEAVGATNIAPFGGSGTANRFRLQSEGTTGNFHSAAWRAVTPAFFETLHLPLKHGRLFDNRDVPGAPEVVLISESMANRFWPYQDPVGQTLLWGSSGNPKLIVGVVGDLRDLEVGRPPEPTMFRPFAQLTDAPMTLLIRTSGNSGDLNTGIRKALWSIVPDMPVEIASVRAAMARSVLPERSALQLMSVFGAIALAIASFGLYGFISYRVNQRQTEIGIRLALGAHPARVRWSVQQRCLRLVFAGLAIGLPLAYACSHWIAAVLYQTSPADSTAYGAVFLVFCAVALGASLGPANRAARMDPVAAIRHE